MSQCFHPFSLFPRENRLRTNTKEPTLNEVVDVVKAARSTSAPGPSGVPYVVYKRCSKGRGFLKGLWRIRKVVWRRGKVAQHWRFAAGILRRRAHQPSSILGSFHSSIERRWQDILFYCCPAHERVPPVSSQRPPPPVKGNIQRSRPSPLLRLGRSSSNSGVKQGGYWQQLWTGS